jgi:hypothetical protein
MSANNSISSSIDLSLPSFRRSRAFILASLNFIYTESMQQTPETDTPTQFSHSVKIEQTAKGARITVHVNSNDALEAMNQSINLYRATKPQLEQQKEVVAPVEVRT